ncbi:hypothetical protein AKJ16_DCAP09343 [Drosera capensis]
MPGPGPHMMYAMGTSLGLMGLTNSKFGPHHSVVYSVNAFFGPDIGSFADWLCSAVLGVGTPPVADLVHHPVFFVVLLGFPLAVLYSAASRFALRRGVLDSVAGENGQTPTYTWVLSTGWWTDQAPINPDAIVVVGLLCGCLIFGFIYINRVKSSTNIKLQYTQSMKLILTIATLYCFWCASQIYFVKPRRPAVGEEADLGVLLFLFLYFFVAHYLCIASMNLQDYHDSSEQLPLQRTFPVQPESVQPLSELQADAHASWGKTSMKETPKDEPKLSGDDRKHENYSLTVEQGGIVKQ